MRGFAILWVILYHLWTDVRIRNTIAVPATFRLCRISWRAGRSCRVRASAASTRSCAVGYLGVPLFMILSGLSLTLVALRPNAKPVPVASFLYRRLRRVMVPYWFGFAYSVLFALALALVQWQRLGGHGYGWFIGHGDILLNGNQLFAGGLLVPRFWSNGWLFAPEGSLWFVLLIVQYYLLFPPLLRFAVSAPGRGCLPGDGLCDHLLRAQRDRRGGWEPDPG